MKFRNEDGELLTTFLITCFGISVGAALTKDILDRELVSIILDVVFLAWLWQGLAPTWTTTVNQFRANVFAALSIFKPILYIACALVVWATFSNLSSITSMVIDPTLRHVLSGIGATADLCYTAAVLFGVRPRRKRERKSVRFALGMS